MRNLQLDAFRGLAIFIMIFVDAPPDFDSLEPIFKHSDWEGLTIADLAFPAFVFAMGASTAFSKNRHSIRRVAILFLLGIVFNLILGQFRILGVLQRLAITYLIGSFLIRREKIFLTSAILLAIHSIGLHLYSPQDPFAKDQNLSFAIDLAVLGLDHMYFGGFDPEGIWGSISSVASMLLGFHAGKILRDQNGSLIKFGLILLALGFVWSQFDIVSKPLWTAPFVLINAGIDSILLSLLKFQIQPLLALGTNPLFFYLTTNLALILLWKLDLYVKLWQLSGLSSSMFAASWSLIWLPLAEILYQRRIIVKI